MMKQLLIAGFGGQGIMSMGQILCYAGMLEHKEVSWIPAYGPEMRGGTANCSVSIADTAISSPIVSEPDILIAMNRPSLEKFQRVVKPGGLIFVNSSSIDLRVDRHDLKTYYIPVVQEADGLGGTKVANMVMLGALLEVQPLVKFESVMKSLGKMLSPEKHKFLQLNTKALEAGRKLVIINKTVFAS